MHAKEPDPEDDCRRSSGVLTVREFPLIDNELNFGNAPWMPIMDPVNVLELTERSSGMLDDAKIVYPSIKSELFSVKELSLKVTDSLATDDVLIA